MFACFEFCMAGAVLMLESCRLAEVLFRGKTTNLYDAGS